MLMCGRFTQTADLKTLRDRFSFSKGPADIRPRYNIAPSQEALVIVEDDGRALRSYRWGLIPHWAKDAAIGNRMINARAETLLEKPSFKKPFQERRCLVVADSWFEWQKIPGTKSKTPMRIVLRTRQPSAARSQPQSPPSATAECRRQDAA